MNNYIPQCVLVTGGAGFIGSHFVRYYLKNYPDIKIINLDKLTYAGSLSNLPAQDIQKAALASHYHFIKGDICDRDLLNNLLQSYSIDTIVHFAAESHVDRSIAHPDTFIHTNILGTFTLLEACLTYWEKENKIKNHQCRFHHISTDEVYGSLSTNDAAFTETTPYAPNSPYSASKASSDHLVRAYFHTYGLPITVSNCSNNYGPFQHREKFIPTIIRSCLHAEPIPVYGEGLNIRDWLHVEDHCQAIDLVIRSGQVGECYNIGGDEELKNLDVVNIVCQLMNHLRPREFSYEQLIQFVKDRPGHDWRYAINFEKIQSQLAWSPKIQFVDGITETVKWFLSSFETTQEECHAKR